MMKLRPKLSMSIPSREIERMHRAALRIISEVGIALPKGEILMMLADYDGVKIKGERVYIDEELINEYVDRHRSETERRVYRSGTEISLVSYAYASYIVDSETDHIRPITAQDLVDMTKLVDSLGGSGYPLTGGAPGYPQDVPDPLRPIAQYKIGAQFSRTGGPVDIPSVEAAEYIRRMAQVMGWPFSLSLYMFSPLRVDISSLERILHFLEKNEDMSLSVGSMPLVGATTPISISGAITQSIAEVLGGFTILKLLSCDREIDFNISLYPFDMKYGNIALGSPEQSLFELIVGEVNRFYNGPHAVSNGPLHSSGILPSAQTSAEKASTALFRALAGTRIFTCGGSPATTLFSAEQLVIDCEIVEYVNRFIRGCDIDFDDLSFDLIEQMSEDARYLEHESTVENFRELYWMPRLFEHIPFQAWFERGQRKLRDRAREVVNEMISKHGYHLDDDKECELEGIYKEAEAKLC
ncbi:MAG: trimethylamine methyltransferase family protein [bacterium]